MAINVKTGMPPFGILANHKIKMCHKDYSQQLQFLNIYLIMRAKKLLTSCQIFRYALPARTVTKKALAIWPVTNYTSLRHSHMFV